MKTKLYDFLSRCKAILTEYETKHNAPVAVDEHTVSLINVETKLQNIFNEQKTKFTKVLYLARTVSVMARIL